MSAKTVVAALSILIAFAAYRVGRRQQAFSQARCDVRDQRGKLRKARAARTTLGRVAAGGWLLLLVCVVVAVLVFAP
jgi:hypothetical protein